MASNYTFSHPASPDDIHGSTSWHQELAGSGRRTERMKRSHAVRAGQMYALPVLPNPLGEAAAFVREIERAEELNRRSTLRNAVVGGVLGAAIVHAWRNR